MSHDHDHEAFDAEPTRVLSDGEPKTPLWLPALGAVLFVVFGVALAAGDETTAPDPGATAGTSATAVAPSVAPSAAPATDAPPLRQPRPATSRGLRPTRVGKDGRPTPDDGRAPPPNPVRRLPPVPRGDAPVAPPGAPAAPKEERKP